MSMYVCLSVCLCVCTCWCVCPRAYLRKYIMQSSPKCCAYSRGPMAVTLFSFGGVAIRYVRPGVAFAQNRPYRVQCTTAMLVDRKYFLLF